MTLVAEKRESENKVTQRMGDEETHTHTQKKRETQNYRKKEQLTQENKRDREKKVKKKMMRKGKVKRDNKKKRIGKHTWWEGRTFTRQSLPGLSYSRSNELNRMKGNNEQESR
jgi:uncharacterized protein YegJ (DUF2314 family)